MATLYITEYDAEPSKAPGLAVPQTIEPAVTSQKVSFTGTAGVSATFNSRSNFVKLYADADCYVLFGANPTATNAHEYLKATTDHWRRLYDNGLKVSAIAVS